MKNLNYFRTINIIFWIIVTAVLMTAVYKIWSDYGNYTIFDFFVSLFIHGGICFFLGYLIDKNK